MGALRNIFTGGKRSPYGYKATVDVFKDEDYCDTNCKGGFYTDMSIHYYADTLCSLGRLLREREKDTKNVRIFEVTKRREAEIPRQKYIDDNGDWLPQGSLCESNKRYNAESEEKS